MDSRGGHNESSNANGRSNRLIRHIENHRQRCAFSFIVPLGIWFDLLAIGPLGLLDFLLELILPAPTGHIFHEVYPCVWNWWGCSGVLCETGKSATLLMGRILSLLFLMFQKNCNEFLATLLPLFICRSFKLRPSKVYVYLT